MNYLTFNIYDILFLLFVPIFEEWEADFGRTYVIGNDPLKIKLSKNIEDAWHKGKAFYDSNKEITGSQLYCYCQNL